MTTQTLTYKPGLLDSPLIRIFVNKCEELVLMLTPRRSTVISLGLLIVGLGLPVLMLLGTIPASFLFGYICLACIASGGIAALS